MLPGLDKLARQKRAEQGVAEPPGALHSLPAELQAAALLTRQSCAGKRARLDPPAAANGSQEQADALSELRQAAQRNFRQQRVDTPSYPGLCPPVPGSVLLYTGQLLMLCLCKSRGCGPRQAARHQRAQAGAAQGGCRCTHLQAGPGAGQAHRPRPASQASWPTVGAKQLLSAQV